MDKRADGQGKLGLESFTVVLQYRNHWLSFGCIFTQVGVGTPKAGHQAWPQAYSWLRSAWRTPQRLPRSHQPSWKVLKCLHKPLRRVSQNCMTVLAYRHQNSLHLPSTIHLMTVLTGMFLPMESRDWTHTAMKRLYERSQLINLCISIMCLQFFVVLKSPS